MAPINRDSGTLLGRRMVMAGAPAPDLGRHRHDPALQAFYRRLIVRGRPATVSITACMRTLLVILNAILRDQNSKATRLTRTQSLRRWPFPP